MTARFGPAGYSDSFTAMGYKTALQIPQYLAERGLNHYEYQCGRGVNIGVEKARQLGGVAAEYGITLSLHAPYYISMSSVEAEKRAHSVDYILASAAVIAAMGGDRIVVHTGSCGKISRSEALELAVDTMKQAIAALDAAELGAVHICPETMGKVNQLGTLEEVLTLCTVDERLIPCIDFGHLNARDQGYFKQRADYDAVFRAMQNRLGTDRARRFHAHFSKIEYTAGGEKRHLTFADTQYGPDFEPVMDLTVQYGCTPIFVCESAGTQAEDAAQMQQYYLGVLK